MRARAASTREFVRTVTEFSRRVSSIVAERRERRAEPPTPDVAVAELESTEEELRVAIEELEQQNEELSRTTAELEAEHLRYRDLFHEAPDAYFVTTTNGTIREANAAAARLLNVPAPFLRDKVLLHFVARQDARTFRDALRALGQAPERISLTVRLRPRKGAGVLPVALAATPVRARGSATLLRWLARPAREASVMAAVEELTQHTERTLASIDVLRSPLSDGVTREAALTTLERIAADQQKLLQALATPAPPAPVSCTGAAAPRTSGRSDDGSQPPPP